MATLAEVARARRGDFRRLLKASRQLDAAQEALEREVKRLTTRKKAVPEAEDAARITRMIGDVSKALEGMAQIMASIADNWRAL